MRSLRLNSNWPTIWPDDFRMRRVPIGEWDSDTLDNADLVLFHIRGRVCNDWSKRSCNYQVCYGDVEWIRNNRVVEEIGWLSPASPACKYDEIIYLYEKYKTKK